MVVSQHFPLWVLRLGNTVLHRKAVPAFTQGLTSPTPVDVRPNRLAGAEGGQRLLVDAVSTG